MLNLNQLTLSLAIVSIALAAGLSTAGQTDPAVPLAPGYGKLGYELPEAGSYTLPPLGFAADGEVLDTQGKPARLHDFYSDKFVLLSFIYSTCSDVNGCPLTAHVFYKIKAAMKRDPALAARLRLISLSFDPAQDTPEVMHLYADNFSYAGKAGEWQFLTTRSEAQLHPILDAYNQDFQRQLNERGEATNDFSHILRVFLIDPEKRIRNIYSVAFLHADLILNDVRSLLMENGIAQAVKIPDTASLSVPGDDRRGYETTSYQTSSQAVNLRRGKAANLMDLVENPPLGLPPVSVPADNPLSAEKISLGRKLFFDRRLSLNNTMSCAMCHIPEQGFANNELATAVGIEGRTVRRNSPSIYNVAYMKRLFHDSREATLEQQIWGPLLAKNEMGNPSVGSVLEKIRQLPDYEGRFEALFDGRGPGMETLGMAIAAYERSLVSANSAFDRWYFGKQEDALGDNARRGFELFTGKAKCASCHTVAADHALFTDHQPHNTGLGYRASMGVTREATRVQLAPGVFVDIEPSIIDAVSEPAPADVGLYEVTQNPDDRWKYKTPGLRNVALTAPYMHNGALGTLEEVVRFYNRGGEPNELLDPRIRPLNLSEEEIHAIVAFLESLTGDNVNTLIADAFAAPVGDIGSADPQRTQGPVSARQSPGGDFELTDHNGQPFRLKQLRGKIGLMFFGYTSCPDVCPMELNGLASALRTLSVEADKIQALFITVDPERDSPAILKKYLHYFHPGLLGLTGNPGQITQVAENYHVSIKKISRGEKNYTVEHGAKLILLGPDGRPAAMIPYGFPPEHIVARVRAEIKKHGL